MADFVSDIRDIKFALFEQLEIDKLLSTERFSEFTREDVEMILDEGYKFAKEVLAPCNAEGDRQGCTFEDGKVTVPSVYREPYKMFAENGWVALNQSAEWGGQGAPQSLMTAVCDCFFGANISINLGALLTNGAAHLIEAFGSDELKQTYCEKMYTGVWTGTMCLTESQAGTDVGASATKARKEGDHYLIEGEKIFITFGDHDLTDNVVHAVLARTEGAPKGTKGLSLFVVPKYRVNADGSLGEFNDVVCSNIEHKLGIHGSPTCTLVFGSDGKCQGWLLGEENMGIKYMFQMMNEARISVGLQGVGIANAAYQAALAYAKERLQGPDIKNFRDPDAPKVPIIKHPDVRMMLMRQKAYSEGCRAMLLFASYCEDISQSTDDEATRNKYHGLLEIMTPICKAYCSDMGFRVTEWALQTLGGYGYCSEYPVEQYLRDCKIASIYEGANGIQAMDLVGRKMAANNGANLFSIVGMVGEMITKHKNHPQLADQFAALAAARDAWGDVNTFFIGAALQKQLMTPLVNATQYLSMCGDLLVGYFLCEQAVLAWDKLEAACKEAKVDPTDEEAVAELAKDNPEVCYLDGKIKTTKFFCSYELPQVKSKAEAIKSTDMSALEMVFEGE